MTTRNIIIGAIASMITLTGQAHAQAQSPVTMMYGAGNRGCGEFLQAADDEKRAANTSPAAYIQTSIFNITVTPRAL